VNDGLVQVDIKSVRIAVPVTPKDAEAAEIRYVTALGGALASYRRGRHFRGFGPCVWSAVA
jgi:hypothetical protein